MASIQSLSGFGSASHSSSSKISKSRAKTAVKPILKKLSTQAEKTSLDLDRGWLDQEGQCRNSDGWAGGAGGSYEQQPGKDMSITFNETVGTRRYHHSRSISGASHVSVATSSSSGPRHQVGAPFVHPFQQMPRTSTPPLSYANSQTSFFDITEDDDNDDEQDNGSNSHRNSLQIHPVNANPHSHSQPSLSVRRPSLASTQRTTSYSEVKNAHSPTSSHHPPSLRINTSRVSSTTSAQSSRLAKVESRSDLQLECMLETPNSPANAASTHISSPASSAAPMSPLRSSFDAAGFPRLRAKSDLDTATRAEHLREARRKFELREKAKEEKYAREEIKRRERADNKRAQEQEKHAAALYKEQMAVKARQEAIELEEAIARGKQNRKASATSSGRPSLAISRTSMSRPGTSRKNAPSPLAESDRFASSNYDSLDAKNPPAFGNEAGGAHDVAFQPSKRRNTARKKTQSTWTMFILWLRTKLLRASKGR
ncbi:uncharacterized protein F4807DRAFT_276134 [Annulohypoxylon truncatum]|uniref:uncharacterized protein n=1 Tax=Annulohypoxylon truncatum TaxID=327061 RepID=UPI002007DB68|nr:uncharacterized protein F4807DRAFT_276134 [Annulohypoxylon truncatum]KAI1205603.1 hypothetical protein F4807DRAFT_276134 [Annulohypoxylon truncatum]